MSEPTTKTASETTPPSPSDSAESRQAAPPREIGGPKGPEPTRYGDWEKNGRCVDF